MHPWMIAGLVPLVLLFAACWGQVRASWKAGHVRERSCLDHVVRVLYRQCGRWALAAEQDESEVVRLLHANYAAGYLWAIKDIATGDDFARATGGQDLLVLEERVVQVQDAATRAMVATCPSLAHNVDPVLLHAAYAYPELLPKTKI